MSDFYAQIFFEAMHTASIVPFSSEPALYAMKAFGTYEMRLPTAIGLSGALAGHAVNWWIGKALRQWQQHRKKLNDETYQKAQNYFTRFGIYALLIAWMPMCNFLTVAAGFLNAPARKSLLLITLGLAWHYGKILS